MRSFGIEKPCSENWNAMTPTQQGAYCSKCALNVHDFTNRSGQEIKQVLLSSRGGAICGRITKKQEDDLNAEFDRWSAKPDKSLQRAFLVSLIVVFGLSLFSCSDQQDKKAIRQFRKEVKNIVKQQEPVIEAPVDIAQPVKPVPPPVEMLYDFPQAVITVEAPLEEEAKYTELSPERGYLGGMGYSMRFEEFLVETVSPVDEYDSLGYLLPVEFSSLAFPNPTASNTTLEIAVAKADNFSINLMDLNGIHLQTVYSGRLERSTFRKEIDLADLPAGTYLITIYSGEYKEVVRVVRI